MPISKETKLIKEFTALRQGGAEAIAKYEQEHPELFDYVRTEMAKPENQYLLIGDTDHNDEYLGTFLASPSMAALFNEASIQTVCVEKRRELVPGHLLENYQKKIEAYQSETNPRKKSRKLENLKKAQYNNILSGKIQNFPLMGLKIIPVDSMQWFYDENHTFRERIFLGDREVSDYIEKQTKGQKSAVIYGASHFRYNGTIGARLKSKSITIDIFADEKAFLYRKTNSHVDVKPDRVYFLQERKLKMPPNDLYKMVDDKMKDPIQRGKALVASLYGPDAPPDVKAQNIAENIIPIGIDPEYFNYISYEP